MEHDELAQHLESLRRESCYRVDAVLKQSPSEITQRVYFTGENGAETGPFIRKFIKRAQGIGSVYERIYSAQQRGHRFRHIPDMIECYARDDELVVVMEHVCGQTLQEAVYERDPSVQLARDTFPQLCDAVGELHLEFSPPIIHRDLKPSNIVLSDEGLVLIDFGISREYDDEADADTTHFGTREFAPPEQYGFGQTGTYSDIYSLGMVLYFCLTEEIPSAQARKRAFHHPNIPESMRKVIERATSLDPASRFADTGELKGEFLKAVRDCEVTRNRDTAPSDAAPRAAARPRRKRTWAYVALAALVCACLAGVALFSWSSGRNADNHEPASTDQSSAEESADGEGLSTDALPEQGNLSSDSSNSPASDEPDATSEQIELAMDLGNQAQPKDGYDPATNAFVDVAGVTFQIPAYFLAATSTGEDGTSFYYAETGSSVAMIMMQEHVMGEQDGRAEFEAAKDDYIEGLMTAEVFDKVTASTDYELAGLSARVVSMTGSVKGIPTTYKAIVFYNPDSHTLGTLNFGQTDNTQFDYSLDFAKVITSAKRS